MVGIENYISDFYSLFPDKNFLAWEISGKIATMIEDKITDLDEEFVINEGVAIHKSAVIESGVILKAPVIIQKNCFIGANAYLRNGVYLDENVSIGTGCEIKASIIFKNSSIAHFNFIGDSIIGKNVNFEAGSITANHFNEREDKRISLRVGEKIIHSKSEKFGAIVGDFSKIGANAVLSPGTILEIKSVVKRLALIEQIQN